ncbi:putative permease [Rhodopseudomonas julia]|uniref:Permease n=1 Tax=Rhodopseudomonas julia TaxID=200617 RepID=A0ABU0C9A9_9BRAD|nr:AEC family transporter [Rhodopseudomonas julia]MDQ0327118.1 putative permease [Rhodopseudomonas julia]
MSDVVGLALPFFGLILLGFVAGRIWHEDEKALAWLNLYVIYFALPALFFEVLSKTPIEELTNGSFIFATTFATYTAFAFAFAFAVLRNDGRIPEATVQGLVGGYGNVGYMGAPLAIVALGPQAAAPAALIFSFDVTLVFTLAPLMMAMSGASHQPIGSILTSIPRKVLLHPFILATLAGVAAAFIGVGLPAPLERFLSLLGGSAAPCALFALGVTVGLRPLRRVPGELPVLIAIKLLVHPLIAYLLLTWIGGFDPIWIQTGVLMAALPPAATIYVIAAQYRIYVLEGSSGILLGTAASVVTLSLVLYLVTTGLLPLDPFGS